MGPTHYPGQDVISHTYIPRLNTDRAPMDYRANVPLQHMPATCENSGRSETQNRGVLHPTPADVHAETETMTKKRFILPHIMETPEKTQAPNSPSGSVAQTQELIYDKPSKVVPSPDKHDQGLYEPLFVDLPLCDKADCRPAPGNKPATPEYTLKPNAYRVSIPSPDADGDYTNMHDKDFLVSTVTRTRQQ